jgi:hypothetical protein
LAQSPSHLLSKHPPRDFEFAIYHNPNYGVSFRYSRNYLLQELEQDPEQDPENDNADSFNSAFLLTPQELAADQPGAILVATLLIPDDAYPNTTFVRGHLQFVVNPHATVESCLALVAPPDSAWPASIDVLALQGIAFHWRDRGSVSPSEISAGREYAGFSNGACYEFFLEVVSAPANGSAPVAPADLAKILRPLERTVSSFQFHAAAATSNDGVKR